MIEIENINNNPNVVFYDNDPKYVAKISKDDKTVYITHKRKDYGNKFQYGIIVNDQEIYYIDSDYTKEFLKALEEYITKKFN